MGHVIVLFFAIAALIYVYNYRGNMQVFGFLLFVLFVPGGAPVAGLQFIQFLLFLTVVGIAVTPGAIAKLKSFPLKYVFIICAVCFLTIGIFDARLIGYQKLAKPIAFMTQNLICCLFAYITLYNVTNYSNLFRKLFYVFAIFGLYGIVCFLLRSNPYSAIFATTFSMPDYMKGYLQTGDTRLRVNSFSFHPYLYGMLLIIMFLFSFFYYKNLHLLKIKKGNFLMLMGLIFINIFMTNSRSLLVVLVITCGCYFIFTVSSARVFQYVLFAPLVLILLMQIPKVGEVVDTLTDIATTGGEKSSNGGSSVDMRQQQLLLSLKYYSDNPTFGNGYDYIIENLKFSSDANKRESDAEAFGFESYAYIILIEQGTVGIVANSILFIALLVYHIRNIFRLADQARLFVIVNFLIIVGYLIFIFTTGTLSSMPFFFVIMGISIGVQQKALKIEKAHSLNKVSLA